MSSLSQHHKLALFTPTNYATLHHNGPGFTSTQLSYQLERFSRHLILEGLHAKTPGDWRARKIYTEIPTLKHGELSRRHNPMDYPADSAAILRINSEDGETMRRICPTKMGTQDSLTRFLMGSYHHHTRKGRYARRGQLTSSPHILLAFRLRSRGRISFGMLVPVSYTHLTLPTICSV